MAFKKQLALTLTSLAVGAAMIGGGTFAYFSSTATSSGNTFATGTIDIATSFTKTEFQVTEAKPGTQFDGTYVIQNTGTLNSNLTLRFANTIVTNPDAQGNLADVLKVTSLNYGTNNLLSQVTDQNNNGYIDLDDVSKVNLNLGAANAGMTATTLTVGGVFYESNAPQNQYQDDALNTTLTFEARQQ